MRKIILLLFCALPCIMWAQEQMDYRYWFDQSGTSATTGSTLGGDINMDIDVSQLPMGVHSLNYQIYKSSKGSSIVHTAYFYKGNYSKRKYTVWVDGQMIEANNLSEDESVFSLNLEVSDLPLGLHSVLVMATDEEGTSAPAAKTIFLKVPLASENRMVTFIIDGKTMEQHEVSAGETSVQYNIDTDSLYIGLHSLVTLLTDGTGTCTQVAQVFFAMVSPMMDLGNLKMSYTIDNAGSKQEKCIVTDSLVYAELDLSTLADGEHTITFFVYDGNGYVSQTMTADFTKTGSSSGIGQIIINTRRNSQYVYNLGGVLVSTKGISGLPNGVYIVNGRKIVK